jgi:hypothetical protein
LGNELASFRIAVDNFLVCHGCCEPFCPREGRLGWMVTSLASLGTCWRGAVLSPVRDRNLPELLGLTLGSQQTYCVGTSSRTSSHEVPSEATVSAVAFASLDIKLYFSLCTKSQRIATTILQGVGERAKYHNRLGLWKSSATLDTGLT